MKRRLALLPLVVIAGLACLVIVQTRSSVDADFETAIPQPHLPESALPFAEKANRIRALHEKKRPNEPGDWLERFPEGGQTFAQYVQRRENNPLCETYATIDVLPLGEFDEIQRSIAEKTAEFMGYFFGVNVRKLESRPMEDIPNDAHRLRNGEEQVLTTWILDEKLKPSRREDAMALIGLVTCDLWPGDLNWVFGQASLQERVGVWSLHRNGDPRESPESFRVCLRRTLKTAVHETGHMLGIPHCVAYECCMCGSRSREECDRRPVEFCPECQPKIWWTCRADPEIRSRRLLEFAEREGLRPEAELWRKELSVLRETRK